MQDEEPQGQGTRDRANAIPNANSPQLLTHLLETVAGGIRSTRGLQEALGVDRRTVLYYQQAGVWLGFMEDAAEALLTPTGLCYVYGADQRRAVYAAAVAAQPFIADLLRRHGALPAAATLVAEIRRHDPGLAASTAERRASAVRSLMTPWIDEVPQGSPAPAPDHQLPLPLPSTPKLVHPALLTRAAGRSFSPDIYQFLLATLLDHGELTLGHVRGVLDAAGAADVALGAYIDLAIERGDGVRVDERLTVTPGAVARRYVADTATAIILSDGGWRSHIEALAARSSDDKRTPTPGRYRLWDHRLFGKELAPDEVPAGLLRVLRDRTLGSWPRTAPSSEAAPTPIQEPFLDAWGQPGLVIALPPSLAQLTEGIAGVNRRLRNARHRADAVGAPSIAYRPSVVHGGLLHPGEPTPRAVPDTRALRQRLIMHAPYAAMATALLLGHRHVAGRVEIVREQHAWWVACSRRRLGPVMDVVDAFAGKRGWLPSRRTGGGLNGDGLLSLLVHLGVALRAKDRLVLHEGFFHQLRSDEEEMQLGAALSPLADAMVEHADTLAARNPA